MMIDNETRYMNKDKLQNTRELVDSLRLVSRIPDHVEKMILQSILEHRHPHEDLAMTFGRLMQLAELQMQNNSDEHKQIMNEG